jgi:hypothetical protein
MSGRVSPVAALRALAVPARLWEMDEGPSRALGWHHPEELEGSHLDEAHVRFIAAASPDVVLALCDLYDEVARLSRNWEAEPEEDWCGQEVADLLEPALSAARQVIEGGAR